MSTIQAMDKEDGNLLDKVQIIANDVDTSKPGTYEVRYEVTDSDGNKASFVRQVLVTEAPTITGEKTITLKQGDLFDVLSSLEAQDKEDGDLTKQITVLMSNVNVPGTYYVTYQVADSDGNTATFTRTVIVKPVVKPVVIHQDTDSIVVQPMKKPTQEKATLPKTGDQSSAPLGLAGLALLALSGLLFWRKK